MIKPTNGASNLAAAATSADADADADSLNLGDIDVDSDLISITSTEGYSAIGDLREAGIDPENLRIGDVDNPEPAKYDPEEHRPLRPRHEAFLQHYIIHLDATKAAFAAGYGSESKRGLARVRGCQILAMPHVQRRLRELLRNRYDMLGVQQMQTLVELNRIAYSDPAAFLDADNCCIPIRELPLGVRRAIKKFKIRTDINGVTTYEYELYDKTPALRTLTQIAKLTPGDSNVNVFGNVGVVASGNANVNVQVSSAPVPFDSLSLELRKAIVAELEGKQLQITQGQQAGEVIDVTAKLVE